MFRAYQGCWFVTRGQVMRGPFPDDQVLRVLRMACTLCIDGCEKGPGKLGWSELGEGRPLRRDPKWREFQAEELPPSVTHYQVQGLEPVAGCCTVFDGWPRLAQAPQHGGTGVLDWPLYVSQEPAQLGVLREARNAHPAGSLVLAQDPISGSPCRANYLLTEQNPDGYRTDREKAEAG